MTKAQAWQRLRDAVQVVCDQKLLLHHTISTFPPAEDGPGPAKHADGCPGCELREALAGLEGVEPSGLKSLAS